MCRARVSAHAGALAGSRTPGCACFRVCVRSCMRAFVCAFVHACVCVDDYYIILYYIILYYIIYAGARASSCWRTCGCACLCVYK